MYTFYFINVPHNGDDTPQDSPYNRPRRPRGGVEV